MLNNVTTLTNKVTNLKGSDSHLQTILNMKFGIDEKYTLMIMSMKSHKYRFKNFKLEMNNLTSFPAKYYYIHVAFYCNMYNILLYI